MNTLKLKIQSLIDTYKNPQKIAFSIKYPKLKPIIILLRSNINLIKNFCNIHISTSHSKQYFPHILARHQSVLRRKLGESSPKLQENKVTNIQQAIKHLDGIIIPPGKIFSFWKHVGQPTREKGYLDGMLLSNGKVIEGVGGGLCQLSNFLYWIFLHAETKIIERYHHSLDVFPDSGRVLPFGSGATISYNMIDLKIKNISKYPIQIKLWLTNNHLKGQLRSPVAHTIKYHIQEKNHCFIKKGEKYFRYNELYRETKIAGKIQDFSFITQNFAPVLYTIPQNYFFQNNFELIDYTDEKL